MSLNVSVLKESFELACPSDREKQLFAEQFYQRLFVTYPQVRPLFAHTDMQEQTKKLMASLVLVLTTLTKPEVLLPTLQRLGQRHTDAGVQVKHYPMVAEALLATFAARLGDRWTDELQEAWTGAYAIIATLMREEPMPAVPLGRESAQHGPC